VAVEERRETDLFTQYLIGGVPGEQMTLYLLKGQGTTGKVEALNLVMNIGNVNMGVKNDNPTVVKNDT